MTIIENTKDLTEFCKQLEKQKFITVDLEFLREKTYYAKLCLIQVASEDNAAIIDPLSKNIDLKPFFKILKNKKITKVFHSCRQDIEILYNLTGFIPAPIFDTQIAAMVCGFGESISYENLVSKILRKSIDKTSRLSNWSKRPLDNKQLEYALSDVTHLVEIYKYLANLLAQTKREKWIDEENEILKDPKTYVVKPEEAWLKIKHRSHNSRFLTTLRELASWREIRAQQKDIPRQTVIKDESLLNIAAVSPKTLKELEEIRNIRRDIVSGKLAAEIISVIDKAGKLPKSKYVKIEKEDKNNTYSVALFELSKLLLKIVSQEKGVVARLIASDDDLRNFSSFKDKGNPMLKGWRYEIFGKQAKELREGKLSIKYNKEKNSIDMN